MDAPSSSCDAMSIPDFTRDSSWKKRRTIIFCCTLSIVFVLNISLEVVALPRMRTQSLENLNWTARNMDLKNHTDRSKGTLCKYMQQFELSSTKRITVCDLPGNDLRVDIRRFIGNSPTIQGIWITKDEFYTLLKLWGKIQDAIHSALLKRKQMSV